MVAADAFGKIGVLMGGPSSEREISLKSGKAVYEALKGAGVDALPLDITTDSIDENIILIGSSGISCAFIALHGRFGEDGQVQDILETLKMPYTGSGVSASRLAMDKVSSRQIFESHDLSVPRYKVMHKGSYLSDTASISEIGFPLVVKPATHGSSIGLSIVREPSGIARALESAFEFDDKILIEEYIKGREMTVGILEDDALPVIEIIPSKSFFDYEAKYQAGMTEYVVPARLDEAIAKNIQSSALSAHRLLGCFGCSRVDLILSERGIPFVLEVNTIPGLTATSLLPKAAKIVGIDFTQLCLKLIRLAYANAKKQG